jgi:hypothetical protein
MELIALAVVVVLALAGAVIGYRRAKSPEGRAEMEGRDLTEHGY